MIINRKIEIAIKLLTFLQSGKVRTVKDFIYATEEKEDYCYSVVRELSKSGMISSVRGIRINKETKDATLLDLYKALRINIRSSKVIRKGSLWKLETRIVQQLQLIKLSEVLQDA